MHALYFRDFLGQLSKHENKGHRYCASIIVITITGSIRFLQVLEMQDLRTGKMSTKKLQYKRAVYDTNELKFKKQA